MKANLRVGALILFLAVLPVLLTAQKQPRTNALSGALQELGAKLADDHKNMSTRYQLEYRSEAIGPGSAVSVAIRRAGVSRTMSFRRPF